MSPFLQLALVLAVILSAAKLSAYLSTRLHQPAVLGELLIGVILGPSLIDLFHLSFITNAHLAETIAELGEIGVLFLMFLAGLEIHFSDLVRNLKISVLAGVLGVLLPLGMGWGLGILLGFGTIPAVYLGLTLGATSVSISAQTLMELKVLRSRVGLGLLGAAVFDDILVILLLSAFLSFQQGAADLATILLILIRMVAVLLVSLVIGRWLLPWIARKVSGLPVSQGVVTMAIVVMLLYSLAAELVGNMAAITGAFLAGLLFARTREKQEIEHGFISLAYGFFVPVFFVSIGLAINLRQVGSNVAWWLLAIFLVAVAGKLGGAALGAWLGGFTPREAVQLGAGMISRGEVGLIVASVGLSQDLVTPDEFSAVVGMVILTTLVTPPLLRYLFPVQPSLHVSTTDVKN